MRRTIGAADAAVKWFQATIESPTVTVRQSRSSPARDAGRRRVADGLTEASPGAYDPAFRRGGRKEPA
jgi:hypothetical protein